MVAIQAYEFWSSIAEEEISRIKNTIYGKVVYGYCTYAWRDLLAIVIGHLKARKCIFDEEWNVVKAGASVMSQFSQVISDFEFIQRIIDFVGGNNFYIIP